MTCNCKNKKCEEKKENLGWTCPKCGKTYSPSVTSCSDCNKKTETNEGMQYQGKTVLVE